MINIQQTSVLETLQATLESWSGWLDIALFDSKLATLTIGGVLQVVFILVSAWVISWLLRSGLKRYAKSQQRMSAPSLYAIDRVTHYILIFIGLMIAIASLGIDVTKFTLLISALGIGVGFGLQNVISNFVAGLMLLFEKTLKVGDFVELESGVNGEVKEINIRSTIITTNDNVDIVVPNSQFVDGRVTNWTMRDTYRRIHVPFGVAYGSDKEKVKEAVLEASSRVPHTLNDESRKPPQVWLVEMGDSALNFELVVWLMPEAVSRPGAVSAAFLWEIHTALVDAGIEIPFPQRDLHIKSWSRPQESDFTANENADDADSAEPEAAPSKPSKNDAAEGL